MEGSVNLKTLLCNKTDIPFTRILLHINIAFTIHFHPNTFQNLTFFSNFDTHSTKQDIFTSTYGRWTTFSCHSCSTNNNSTSCSVHLFFQPQPFTYRLSSVSCILSWHTKAKWHLPRLQCQAMKCSKQQKLYTHTIWSECETCVNCANRIFQTYEITVRQLSMQLIPLTPHFFKYNTNVWPFPATHINNNLFICTPDLCQ